MRAPRFMRGLLAGATLIANPAALHEKPPQPTWEQLSPEHFLAYLAGISAEKIPRELAVKWIDRNAGSMKPTLIIASAGHKGTLGHTNVEGSQQLTKELRPFVDVALHLNKSGKISCIYMESLAFDDANKLNEEGLELMRRIRTSLHAFSDQVEKERVWTSYRSKKALPLDRALVHFEKVMGLLSGAMRSDLEYHSILTQQSIETMRSILDDVRFSSFYGSGIPEKKIEEIREFARRSNSAIEEIISIKGYPNTLVLGLAFHLALQHNVPVRFCGTATPAIKHRIQVLKEEMKEARALPTGLEDQIRDAAQALAVAEERDKATLGNRSLAEGFDTMFDVYNKRTYLKKLESEARTIKNARADDVLERNADFVYGARESATLEAIGYDQKENPTEVIFLEYGLAHSPNWKRRRDETLGPAAINMLELTHRDFSGADKALKRK